MPYSTTWTERGVIWKYSQKVTGGEVIDSNMLIYGDPRFDDIRYQIADLDEVTEYEFDETDMRRVAHLDIAAARTNPRIQVALVASQGPGLEIAQNYVEHTDKSPWVHRTFATIEAAQAWINSTITPPPF